MINPSSKTRFRAVASAAVALFFVALAVPQAANAVAAGTVTIVASGGSPEGTNWTFAAGEITPSASVSINASDVVAKLASGSVTILGDKAVINSSIVYANSNALTIKVTGNIIVGGGVTIESQGGNLTFNSDSDANNTGHIRFGQDSVSAAGAIRSNGGNIIVGGGVNPSTSPAMAQNNDPASGLCGGAPPLAGVGVYGYAFNAGGGNISLRGSSPNLGNVSTRAINIASCSWATTSFTTTGTGSVYLNGDGSMIAHNTAWGVAIGVINVTTAAGNITIEGRGSVSGPTNSRGFSLGGASTFTSTTGDIRFIDYTNGAASAGYIGVYLGATVTVNTGGDFLLKSDEISGPALLQLTADSASILPNTGSSFTGLYIVGAINLTNNATLTIGGAGNTSAIRLSNPITTGGDFVITGSTLEFNNTVTATGNVTITSSGTVTQTSTITSAGVTTQGGGTFTLPNVVVVIPPPPPAPPVPPTPVVISGISGTLSSRTVVGTALDKVTAVKVNGVEVKIISSTEGSLSFEVPTLAPGAYDVVLVSSISTLTFSGAIKIAAPVVPRPLNVAYDLSSFSGSATALSRAQKAQVRRVVAGSSGVLCQAYVAARSATAAQRAVGKARAAATCAYARSVAPKLKTTVLVSVGTKEEVAARTVTVVATR
ncbi:MAG: hypothetical protein RLZZ345_775 [Actinomycetota bacterium]|jgi:hypothetical protein